MRNLLFFNFKSLNEAQSANQGITIKQHPAGSERLPRNE